MPTAAAILAVAFGVLLLGVIVVVISLARSNRGGD